MLQENPEMMLPDNVHVLAVVKNDSVRQQLMASFDAMPQITPKIVIGDLESACRHIKDDHDDSILLLEVDKNDENAPEKIQACKAAYKGQNLPLIIAFNDLSDKQMVTLLRTGANDFLSLPVANDEMRASISRVAQHHIKEKRLARQAPKIITFVHASGGMGATTLAVNAATIINETVGEKEKGACFLDLDLQYGGASIHLDLPGYSPVTDLLDKPERLDREMLDGMMMRHPSGLRVLTTPEAPLPVEAITSETINRLLDVAQDRYPYTIVDLPQTLTLWTDTVLQRSDIIYVVMQLTVPSVRQLCRWFGVLEQDGMGSLPIRIVVNRHTPFGRMRHNNISAVQAAEALGRKIDYEIPNDYELILQSLDQGMPAAHINPQSKFILRLQAMLQEVAAEIEPSEKKFLKKILSR